MTGASTTHQIDSGLTDRGDEALTTNPHLLGRTFDYHADEGVVVLTGKVNSFFQKQMAQEAIRRVDGVQHIDNQLEVDWA